MRVPRVSIVGDLMVDVDNFVSGTSEREGRPTFQVSRTVQRLGAAGAVANMVAALGFDAALYASANVRQVPTIKRLAPGFCHILGHDRQTVIRERFQAAEGVPVGPRIDRGGRVALSVEDQRQLASQAISGASAVIICDHAQGVVGSELMKFIKGAGIPVFVDPHPESNFADFGGVECVCANRNEAVGMADVNPDPLYTVQKLDSEGLWVYKRGWREAAAGDESFRQYFEPTCPVALDPLGAGDQFIAALVVARLRGEAWEVAIQTANVAAGLQCERRGIVPVTWEQIKTKVRGQ